MSTHRVTVILSEQEYAQVRTLAGDVPLSRWFRKLALSRSDISVTEMYRPFGEEMIASMTPGDLVPASENKGKRLHVPIVNTVKGSVDFCPHGTVKGKICLQCAGMK